LFGVRTAHPLQSRTPAQEIEMLALFTNANIVPGILVLFLVVAAVFGIFMKFRKNRTEGFRTRFGSEYDRAVEEHGSSKKAEEKLAHRAARVQTLTIRDLNFAEIQRFNGQWQMTQSRFVDHPQAAVIEADDLINALLSARGYPEGGFEQRAADISVGYPAVMEDFRKAHDIAVRRGRDDASTEDLRKAMILYRAMFDEIVAAQKSGSKAAAA
jgi:hypothetical protein